MTPEIRLALLHVQSFHPEVCQVFYGADSRWSFCDIDFNAPTFTEEVDVGILEAAQNSIDDFPCAYYLGGEGYEY